MPKFTTRVELHHTHTREDYDKLHKAMEAEGFSRTISFEGNATVYQLPTAEYNRSAELTTNEIVASAKKAAATVSKEEAAILVTKANGARGISGLKPIKK